MEFKKESTSRIAIFVLCLLFLFLFLYNSSSSSEQLFKGLRLCAETLIPSLFPYMVISEMLVRSGAVSFIAPAAGRVTKKLFRVSGAGGAALILGIICGFPVGAKTVAELYSQNMIEKDEAEKLMGICNLPSPPFIIFAVGDKLFGSREIGLFLYFNVLAVTLLQGMMKRKSSAIGADHIAYNKAQPVFSLFTESVASAAGAVIKVCAFVAFFSAVIGGLTPFFDNTSPILKASIFSFFELASGTKLAHPAIFEAGKFGVTYVMCMLQLLFITVIFNLDGIKRAFRGLRPKKPS